MNKYINKGNSLARLDHLFVYGIFLGADMRYKYDMTSPTYDTVPGFVTFGEYIVQAVPVDPTIDVSLTGLVVDVDPDRWKDIDELESNYERIMVRTSRGKEVYMYAAKGTLASLAEEEKEYEQVIEA